jgi:hypothetical protein
MNNFEEIVNNFFAHLTDGEQTMSDEEIAIGKLI